MFSRNKQILSLLLSVMLLLTACSAQPQSTATKSPEESSAGSGQSTSPGATAGQSQQPSSTAADSAAKAQTKGQDQGQAQPLVAGSGDQLVATLKFAQAGFTTQKADEFLKQSLRFDYPQGESFIPFKLTDSGLVVGTAFCTGSQDSQCLAILNIHTSKLTKVSGLPKCAEPVMVRVWYADDQYVLFEEDDQTNQGSILYLYDLTNGQTKIVKKFDNLPTIHKIEVSRHADQLFLDLYYSDQVDRVYAYSLSKQELSLIEEQNSAFPAYAHGALYYLRSQKGIDLTELVRYDLKTQQKKVVSQVQAPAAYFGLWSNGEKLLSLVHAKDQFTLYSVAAEGQQTALISSSWIESLDYKGQYISFLGEARTTNRNKSQYYLIDLKNKIDYLYNGSVICLSNKGALWIDFKTPTAEIPKGKTFSKQYSVMRYYAFDGSNAGTAPKADNAKVPAATTAQPTTSAQPAAATAAPTSANPDANKKVRLDVQQMIQKRWNWCAVTSVNMILNFKGIEKTQAELAEEMKTDEVFGTHNANAIQVLNKYLFGYETPTGQQPGYRLAKVTSADPNSEDMKLFKQRLIQDVKDGYPIYFTIDNGRIYGGRHGEHNVCVIGYQLDATGKDIAYVYFLDPSYTKQDPVYGGLKKVTPEELLNSMLTCVEPNYAW